MRVVYVIFDDECDFCVQCYRWLMRQVPLVPLRFIPLSTAAKRMRVIFGSSFDLEIGGELTVITDEGAVYRNDGAFLMCLWCLRSYRSWAVRLARPSGRGLARRAYRLVSSQRFRLSRIAGWRGADGDADLEEVLRGMPEIPRCANASTTTVIASAASDAGDGGDGASSG